MAAPELDTDLRDPAGGRIYAPPVEPRHLELAKRNIEQHFIAAAPLESFTSLLLMLRAFIWLWNFRQFLFSSSEMSVPKALPTARRSRPPPADA